MNAKIPCDKTIDLFGGAAPLAVSTDPVTGNITEYHSIEDFTTGCIDERNLKVKPESYIYSKLPDYNCEECTALPFADPQQLDKVIGYRIGGTAKKYDTSQTPHKEIDSQKVSFSIGKEGVLASVKNNTYMPYVLGTDSTVLFAKLAKAGEAVVHHKDLDSAYEIINNGMPETIFRMMVGEKPPVNNADLFIQANEDLKNLSPNLIKKFFFDKKRQILKSIESDSFEQHSIEQPQAHEWKEPVSQRSELLPVQKLTPEMLPLDIAKYVFDEAERADKMPVDFVAASLLSSLGSVLGTKVAIKPKPFDDWAVVANLWSAIVGTPSMKKTPAYHAGLRPISRLIAKAKEEARPKGSGVMAAIVPLTDEEKEKAEKQLIQDRAEQLAAEQELKELKKELAKVKDEVERKAIILKIAEHQIKAEAEEISSMANDEEVPEKRYKTDDSSPEALSDLEANNPNGILVFRDELVGLLASLDKDGGAGRAFYLEGWNGTSSYQLDRIMRGAQYIPNHCLTIMGGIQPDKLIAYLEPAIKGLGNDGLMQRFQLLVYPDSEKWSYVDRIPDKDARNAVYSMFESIDKLNESSLCSMGAKGSDDYNKRPYFVFSDQAQELFIDWMTRLHEKKIPNEEHPIIQEHLSKYPKLMTGLALLFHVIDGVNFGNVGPVSKRATEMAIEWCNYLETHARRIYGLVLHSSGFRASILEKKLRQLHESDKWRVEGFSARDIHRKNWKSLTDIQNVYDALDILCGNNWLVMEEIEPTVKGGRPSKRYWINPRIYEMS